MNREGGISIFRVGVIAAVLGGLFIAGGLIFREWEMSQRRAPFDVDVYPGATEWYRTEPEERPRRIIVYEIPETQASVDQIAGFYQDLLDDHTGADPSDARRERCVRVPRQGNAPDYEPGNGLLPFYWDCTFDNSEFGQRQVTYIRIHPGINDGEVDKEEMTLIVYDQRWED
jgi:hypothetical protein